MSAQKKFNKATIIGIIVGSLAFVVSYFGIQQLFKSDQSIDLQQAVTIVNKKTPFIVDDSTRLDSASAIGNTNFIYHYTLFDIKATEVKLDSVNKYLKPSIISNVSSSPELKGFRDNKVIMDYRYYDSDGMFITEISVTPELYSK
ncbi:hypothetical protein [Nonlabens agnitus]|uniref:Uncharacterized protein n=1 Tax=Nonlabens agnitus TaxID=870484 RepID=A0A2S9WTK6_9FLAO|nr:hypothetical protein [Nonlabens agnitus]PRP66804.1 hypothetical protein BST86_06660 [Nonlabens agnitus]